MNGRNLKSHSSLHSPSAPVCPITPVGSLTRQVLYRSRTPAPSPIHWPESLIPGKLSELPLSNRPRRPGLARVTSSVPDTVHAGAGLYGDPPTGRGQSAPRRGMRPSVFALRTAPLRTALDLETVPALGPRRKPKTVAKSREDAQGTLRPAGSGTEPSRKERSPPEGC